MPHILHSVVTVDKEYGGPARTVPSLCSALQRCCDVDVTLLTTSSAEDNSHPAAKCEVNLQLVSDKSYSSFIHRGHRIIKKHRTKIIHDHGIWLPNNLAVYRLSRENKIPLIVSPRGMLEPWALSYKKWKKKIAWYLYQRRIMNHATAFHVTSEKEAEHIRNLGFRQPIAFIPNGIDFLDKLPERQEKTHKTALFLSRIHPVKGLINLVAAWNQLKPDNWKIRIGGADELGHRVSLEKRIKAAGLDKQFRFLGVLSDREKWQEYVNADLFILPTLSENFGVVIGEALAAGVPVITTKAAPWKLIVDEDCGWWIDEGQAALEDALKDAFTMKDHERQGKGKRGMVMVRKRFNWDDISESMYSFYQWIVKRGDQPDCIIT